MLQRLLLAAIAALAGLAMTSVPLQAQTLDKIKQRGVLVVGTKADYRPFGFLDPSGKIVGFEPELAADVAKRLGVKLELVPVVASNRIQFLQQGKIDIMIATMSDTPERRKIVDIVDPSYYGSGTNILSPKSAGLKTWEALRGKKVCLIQGAFYNKELQEKYGVDGVAFPGTAEVYTALKNGNCVAFAYDDTAIVGEMQKPEWSAYEMPLDSILFVPWGLAVKQGEKGLIIVHTGAGKGKSTAAFGMVLRCLGHGMRVGVVQFVKGAWGTGERTVLARFPDLVTCRAMGEGFTWDTQDRARDIAAARAAWEVATQMIADPSYRLVLLDELNIVLRYGYLPVAEVMAELKAKPRDLHIVVTGRNAPAELVEAADLVTEMTLVKHPFRAGVKAQPGIEF